MNSILPTFQTNRIQIQERIKSIISNYSGENFPPIWDNLQQQSPLILLIVGGILFLIIFVMSRQFGLYPPSPSSSYYGGSGSGSSRRRSQQRPKVRDGDFSYIPPGGIDGEGEQDGVEIEHDNDDNEGPDIILLDHRGIIHPLHFAAYAISEGRLKIGYLRRRAAEATGASSPSHVKLFYKRKLLKDDHRPCVAEGLKQESTVICVVSEVEPDERNGSYGEESRNIPIADNGNGNDDDDDNDDENEEGSATMDGKTKSKKGKKNKKGKKGNKKKKSAAHHQQQEQQDEQEPSAVPSASTLPPPSPDLKQYKTSIEQVGALSTYFKTVLLPLCESYVSNPPSQGKLREYEYRKLNETTMAQVLLKADGIDTVGNEHVRNERKALVKEAQAALSSLDRISRE